MRDTARDLDLCPIPFTGHHIGIRPDSHLQSNFTFNDQSAAVAEWIRRRSSKRRGRLSQPPQEAQDIMTTVQAAAPPPPSTTAPAPTAGAGARRSAWRQYRAWTILATHHTQPTIPECKRESPATISCCFPAARIRCCLSNEGNECAQLGNSRK
ncbi:hypothetical protein DdX_09914 [Ditylenchus destructor]|uniref:Uncharacterized protein n=1 Tax=Ditylenchus destructor TaxID=166010 RepID=A0AAD4MZS1_9BILA|nr:hypothetical protein DdX_09914 [Ditylenchus destructor]